MIADILFYLSSILLLLFFIRSIGPIRPVHIVNSSQTPKPDWLPSWALTSLLTGFVAIELYIQKQLLDLFRYGLWVS